MDSDGVTFVFLYRSDLEQEFSHQLVHCLFNELF
jgi:hypothetical protein